jgi:hypothetical protein
MEIQLTGRGMVTHLKYGNTADWKGYGKPSEVWKYN